MCGVEVVWVVSSDNFPELTISSFNSPWEGEEPTLFKDREAQKAKHSITLKGTGKWYQPGLGDTP